MGKNKINWTIVIVVVVLAAVIGGMFYLAMEQKTPASGGQATIVNGGGSGGAADCNTAPTVSVTAVDGLNLGTGVTVSPSYRVNDVYVGTTAPSFKEGDKVQLLLNATGYVSVIEPVFTVACGNNPQSYANIKANNSPTISIKTDAGTGTLTDSVTGGVTNETAIAAGGSKTWEISFTGASQKTTSDFLYVIEFPAQSASNMTVSGVSMKCSGVNLPQETISSGIASVNANSLRVGFAVPAMEGAGKNVCYLTASTLTSKELHGGVYTDYYGKKSFVDTDGTYAYGVADKLGAVKYIGNVDYDFYIA